MDEEQKEEIRQIVSIALEEFMEKLYGGIGKGIVSKLLWFAAGAVLFYFAGIKMK